MNDPNLSTVERAYQLARSGTCRSVEEIRLTLMRERYDAVQAHLSGPSIKKDLARLCKAAAEAAPDDPQA